MRSLLALCLALAAPAAADEAPIETALGPALDLTHAFDASAIYWPTEEGFVLERGTEGRTAAGYWYAAHRMRLAEHGGTHLDAPSHFHEGGSSAERVSLARLVARAVVVDVREAAARNADRSRSPTSRASRPPTAASPTAPRSSSPPASPRAGPTARATSAPPSGAPPRP